MSTGEYEYEGIFDGPEVKFSQRVAEPAGFYPDPAFKKKKNDPDLTSQNNRIRIPPSKTNPDPDSIKFLPIKIKFFSLSSDIKININEILILSYHFGQ